jgi:hypothetical protein
LLAAEESGTCFQAIRAEDIDAGDPARRDVRTAHGADDGDGQGKVEVVKCSLRVRYAAIQGQGGRFRNGGWQVVAARRNREKQ